MNNEVGYKKEYRIKVLVAGRNSYNVTVPAEVIHREAEKRGITIPEFLDKFRVIAEYNSFEGIHYTFKEAENNHEHKK